MTLINIANGTECRRRDEEVRPSAKQDWKETAVDRGYTRRCGKRRRKRKRKRRRRRRLLWVFIISPSRLDSVKLWNNPLMSPPCRVDRMPTKLSDFSLSLLCPAALFLSLGVSHLLVALARASFHFPIAFLRLFSFFWYQPLPPALPILLSRSAWPTLRSWLLAKTRVALWLGFNRVAWLIPSVWK